MGESAPTMTSEKPVSKHPSAHNPSRFHILPTYHHEGRLVTKGIQPEGESGRAGFHPYHYAKVLWRSSTKVNTWLNVLWPFTIIAIVLFFAFPEYNSVIFATSFLGIVPAASALDFAGAEFARKIPRVIGIVVETLFGGIVEIVLFMILIATHDPSHGHNNVIVIQAAILGSILANILLCLGACFLVGGIRNTEQKFHKVISEVGSGILLMAGVALLIVPTFYSALSGYAVADGQPGYQASELARQVSRISYGTSIVLFIGFFLYIIYNIWSHDSIFDEVLIHDEERDHDRADDLAKQKLTMTEAVITIVISLAFVSLMAYILVAEIEPMIKEHGLHENFLGLILIPVVEKAAEHLSAVDEAYDNQINFALFHCMAPSVQTALFNTPLVIFVGWGLGIKEMNLNFEIFFAVVLVLAIIVVGNVLRDGASDYLEGALLILVYVIIAVAAWNYPDAATLTTNGQQVGEAAGSGGEAVAEHAVQVAKRLIEAGYFPRDL